MADYFADAYFGSKYWTAKYFQAGEIDPNAMSASLSGSGGIAAVLTSVTAPVVIQGGGWLSKEQLREYQKTRKRKRLAIDELEETVERAFASLRGVVPDKQVPDKVAETPSVLVRQAKDISRVLVSRKANKVASLSEIALLKEIKRLSDLVIADMRRRELEEEEAVILLLVS